MLKQYQQKRWSDIIMAGIAIFIFAILWLFNIGFKTPLLLGFIFAILTYPIYNWFCRSLQAANRVKTKKNWTKDISAFLTVFLISLLTIFVFDRFIRQALQEAPSFLASAREAVEEIEETPRVRALLNQWEIDLDVVALELREMVFEITRNFSLKIIDYIAQIVIFILAWYQALLHAKTWQKHIFDLLPFTEYEEEKIRIQLKLGVQNVVYANLLSGLIHALAVFLIMLIFGLPHLFLISMLVFLIGVLPLSPSELGYAIPLIMLVNQGNVISAVILAPVAELLILWVNYVLIPGFIASQDNSNSLLILTSILSGVPIFGLTGFIIGPTLMIFVQTLYRILVDRLTGENSLQTQPQLE